MFARANPSSRVQRFISAFNRFIVWISNTPVIGPVLSRRFVQLTYVGTRTGKIYTFPVWATPASGAIIVPVYWPEQKNWWRLFRGEGREVWITRGTARRAGRGRVIYDGRRVLVRVSWLEETD